jgi:hypothetical protein
MKPARFQASLIVSAVVSAGALLYRFPPEQYSFYPQCPVFRWTHWRCPGCGTTRALAALLHGRFAEALHYNSLFVFLAPVLLSYFVVTYCGSMRKGRLVWPQLSPLILQALLIIAALFTVTRNAYLF